MLKNIIWRAMDRPRTTIAIILLLTVVFGAQFPRFHIDTDPENMLEMDQPDRVTYRRAKKEFGIHDMIVLGITDERGAFRPETLGAVQRIVDAILKIDGVITNDVISLTTTNDVSSKGATLDVHRLMEAVPKDEAGGKAIHEAIKKNPLLADKLASKDGKGLAIYVPIARKDQAHTIGTTIESIAQRELKGGQRYHLAGLPVAEDYFGVEMFQQMAVMAPIAGMVIFLLLWLLFRKLTLVIPAMGVALLSVVWGMGLLIGSGFTLHIMSSMIPVFLMPIAVLDTVHILSEFYDRYPRLRDRRETLRQTVNNLFLPMLYTSITSAVGFASLMLAPIPPVRVFGGFVAFGIMAAWALTMLLVPAAVMLISEKKLEAALCKSGAQSTLLTALLARFGRGVLTRYKLVALLALAMMGVGGFGISRIVVNDNPVNWFAPGHKLRVADTTMNKLFGGTYMAYLLVEGKEKQAIKDPAVMRYVEKLQRLLEKDKAVGKTSSVADILTQVAAVMHGDEKMRKVPDNRRALAQYLLLFQMAGEPGDLDNFVDYDYRLANIWVQMRRGENRDMSRVEALVNAYLQQNPAPGGVTIRWSGLTYINKVWQDLMVVGMRNAVFGGFAVVMVLMVILFRSLRLGFISVLPLSFAIGLSYGLVGLIGKDYDMPIAVCSSLAIGLSIDFAIHFVQRARDRLSRGEDLETVNDYMFNEPGRAISRNAIVIVVGFLPMVFATLTPYRTVGAFFALVMLFSTLATLGLLPGLLKMMPKKIAALRGAATKGDDR